MSSSSKCSKSKSHSASSAVLLSASRNALICSGVRSSAIMHGTSASPSFFAAFNRVCPATISPFASITIGTLKPNSLMLAATASTAPSFFRGLRLYGFSSPSGLYMICLRISSILHSNAKPRRLDEVLLFLLLNFCCRISACFNRWSNMRRKLPLRHNRTAACGSA